jgi:exosome complex component RRP40
MTSCHHRLLQPDSAVLAKLGALLSFEIAVGLNGRVWVKAGTVQHSILVANSILASEHMSAAQVEDMLAHVWRTV